MRIRQSTRGKGSAAFVSILRRLGPTVSPHFRSCTRQRRARDQHDLLFRSQKRAMKVLEESARAEVDQAQGAVREGDWSFPSHRQAGTSELQDDIRQTVV